MDKCREAFEKLPEINAILHGSEFGFNESINQYYHPHHTEHRLNYAFLMGAWSVWQSRQAEVDEKDKRIESALYVLKGLKAENDLWGCDQVEVQIEILEKALRGEHE